MTTHRLHPHEHPIYWSLAAITLYVGILLAAAGFLVYVPPLALRVINQGLRSAPASGATLPFTVDEVQTYFAREIGTPPAKFGSTTVFSQAATPKDTDDYVVAVSGDKAGLSITFRGTGVTAVEMAKAFCSSSLFRSAETAALTGMIGQRLECPSAQLSRFTADIRVTESIDMYQMTIQFRRRE